MGGLKEVLVPDIGDIDEAYVIEILVAPGDSVEIDDSLITLESNKATMEIPSPYAGVIRELMVGEGDEVTQGALILTLEEGVDEGKPESPPRKDEKQTVQPESEAPPQAGEKTSTPPPVVAEDTRQTEQKPHASPSAHRFARELGVDLSLVTPSGPAGRVVKQDIQGFVKEALSRGIVRDATASESPEIADIDYSKFGETEVQPLSRTQMKSSTHLQHSWQTVPHVTQFDEADITDLEAFRKQKKADTEKQHIRLTLLAFLMKASAAALKQYPGLNASLDAGGKNVILKKYHHIGFAVDTEAGLVVPVIRNVDQKGLLELAQELAELTTRAREQRLELSQTQGASFTISSLGGISGTGFTPIVNPPEAAILGVSRAAIRPVYQDDEFVPRLMLPFSLSYDHRIIDGAEAARFTRSLASELADIRNLLL